MTLYQWLCLLGTPSVLAGLYACARVQLRREKALRLGLQALLRDRLLQAFRYYAARGCADYSEKANVDNLMAQYEALGANGIMTDLYARFRELPERRRGRGPEENGPYMKEEYL